MREIWRAQAPYRRLPGVDRVCGLDRSQLHPSAHEHSPCMCAYPCVRSPSKIWLFRGTPADYTGLAGRNIYEPAGVASLRGFAPSLTAGGRAHGQGRTARRCGGRGPAQWGPPPCAAPIPGALTETRRCHDYAATALPLAGGQQAGHLLLPACSCVVFAGRVPGVRRQKSKDGMAGPVSSPSSVMKKAASGMTLRRSEERMVRRLFFDRCPSTLSGLVARGSTRRNSSISSQTRTRVRSLRPTRCGWRCYAKASSAGGSCLESSANALQLRTAVGNKFGRDPTRAVV